ncbi:hypothetical protein KDA_32280 [Dictyobacter alpinus]|uniref:Uncharacterized protein n=1 Tax=Dictyobacter alpinus TaxID=2014873 RepID=A0A402B8P4_9CHLR|nr:hypothetical protein KDA_32280 [Dictyobacter alpinus]
MVYCWSYRLMAGGICHCVQVPLFTLYIEITNVMVFFGQNADMKRIIYAISLHIKDHLSCGKITMLMN